MISRKESYLPCSRLTVAIGPMGPYFHPQWAIKNMFENKAIKLHITSENSVHRNIECILKSHILVLKMLLSFYPGNPDESMMVVTHQ